MSVTFQVGGLILDNGVTINPSNLPIASDTTPGGVIIGQNLSIDKSGAIAVASSSTSEPGIVQLNDSTTSTSTTQAATANAVKSAYDAAIAAQGSAAGCLPLTGGTMTGDITFGVLDQGIYFADGDGYVTAISDLVDYMSSNTAASSAAVKTANDNALSAQATANAALPKSGGTMTGPITFAAEQTFPVAGIQDATTGQKGVVQVGSNIQVSSGTISVNTATTGQLGVVQVGTNIDVTDGTISVASGSTSAAGVLQLTDSTSSTSTTTAATPNSVKSAYDLANSAQSTANNALPLTGGTMTGNITFQDVNEGVVFNGGSTIYAISDSTTTTSSTTAASSTAVNTLRGNAILKSTLTATGDMIYASAAGVPARLPIGTGGYFLTVKGGTPFWDVFPLAGGTSAASTRYGTGAGGASGTNNVTVGASAGAALTTGSISNVALGYQALLASTIGDYNTALGAQALVAATGNSNIGIGYQAGNLITTGTGNVILGSTGGSTTLTNNLIIATGNGIKLQINENGAVGVGATPAYGTSGQVLTSAGSGAAPTWTTLASKVSGVTATAPITVDNTDPLNPIIGISAASTSASGAVQLTDSTSSTSTTTAATPNSVKTAYDLAAAALPLSGGTMSGDLYLYSQTPIDPAQAASKYYVDQVASGGNKPQAAVACATTAAFAGTVTYANGTSGVGATLTLSTPITTIDGVTITTVGTRILVKNQASALQNGVYTYTSGGATTVLTRATDADQLAEVPYGSTYYVNAGTVNGTQTFIQYTTITSFGTSPFSYSLTSTKPFHKYSLEWNVDPIAGDDTTGTGSEEQPYKTIAKALTSAGSGNYARIVLHQGIYNENLTISQQNLDITGGNRGGATINGTVAVTNTASSVRIYGVQFQGNITHSGAGSCYLQAYTLASGVSITKSGNGYLELDDGAQDTNGVNITGAGYVNIYNSRVGAVTVNNASAVLTMQDNSLITTLTVTNGIAVINGASIFALTESGNAVTSSAGTSVFLRDTTLYTPSGAIARMSVAGNYTLNDVVFDRTNSTLGTNLGTALARFDSIDTFGALLANGNAGSNGQILMSKGAGVAPQWTSSAGALSNYGQFLSTQTQTNADTVNGNAVTLNTPAGARNFSVASNSRITAAVAGTYNLMTSIQFFKDDAGTDDVRFWIKINGNNVANSTTNLTLQGNNVYQLGTVNWIIDLAAGDYVEIWWYSIDTQMQLLYEAAAAPYPAIPSVIATIVPVGA